MRDEYLDSYWQIPGDFLWYKVCPRWVHRVFGYLENLYYYHKSSVAHLLKYKAYFPNSHVWELSSALDRFIVPRLRAVVDSAHDDTTPCVRPEQIELSGLPKSWFTKQDVFIVFKKGKWKQTLNLIIEGLDYQENQYDDQWFWGGDAKYEKKWIKRDKEIAENRTRATKLVGVFYDNLWD